MYISNAYFDIKTSGFEFKATLTIVFDNEHNITYMQWDNAEGVADIMDIIGELVECAYIEGHQKKGDMVIFKTDYSDDPMVTWKDMYYADDDGPMLDEVSFTAYEY